ncbi:MAG: TfpX/TfpZ family type IV pilin accessory protein, partial [Caldimonas sp.]
TSVDVVIGPVLTFAIFNLAKGWRHLRRDLAVIGVLQIAALAYGLHTVYIARPVAMVFEVDRFRLITANNVVLEELPKAPPELRELPLDGPRLLGARRPEMGAERNDAMMMGVGGVDVGQRPLFWQAYALAQDRALARSKPLSVLFEHYPKQAAESRLRLIDLKADEASARFLPVMARSPWVAVLDKAGTVLGYLPLDGFF